MFLASKHASIFAQIFKEKLKAVSHFHSEKNEQKTHLEKPTQSQKRLGKGSEVSPRRTGKKSRGLENTIPEVQKIGNRTEAQKKPSKQK